MNFHHPFFPRHQLLCKFGDKMPTDPLAKALGLGKNLAPNSGTPGLGGSGSSEADAINAANVPTPATPAGPSDEAVMQQMHDVAQQGLLKKSVKNTIYAGDTGGYRPAAS